MLALSFVLCWKANFIFYMKAVPCYGQASVKVLLRRDQVTSSCGLTEKFIDAFALGYLTPFEQTSKPYVVRRHGLHMDPLRLGLSAHIKKAQVTVEASDDDYFDEDGSLIFHVEASSLIRNGQVSKYFNVMAKVSYIYSLSQLILEMERAWPLIAMQ
jgi:hypothetical protein